VVQVRARGTVEGGRPAALDALRAEFARRHCVRLPSLLEPDLADRLAGRLDEATFVEHVHPGIGSNRELCLRADPTVAVLQLLLSGDAVVRAVEAITGCAPIGSLTGRVYRMSGPRGHHDAWHDDVADHRLVGLTVNLSPRPYRGGDLQIRDRASRRVLCEMAPRGLGDALVFRLRVDLQHRVTDVEGEVPRTAFAGWFRGVPGPGWRPRARAAG
jgi:hypothetical protein